MILCAEAECVSLRERPGFAVPLHHLMPGTVHGNSQQQLMGMT